MVREKEGSAMRSTQGAKMSDAALDGLARVLIVANAEESRGKSARISHEQQDCA